MAQTAAPAAKTPGEKKNTTKIVIIVVAIIAVLGIGYGLNSWNQRRMARNAIKQLYGIDVGGVAGGVVGSVANNALTNAALQEMAKQAAADEAKQKADEAREAEKTPEDKFGEAKEAAAIGGVSPVVSGEIRPVLEAVFGRVKMAGYNSGFSADAGTFIVTFMAPREVSADDLTAIAERLGGKGYALMGSTADASSGDIGLQKGEASLSFSFDIDSEPQQISAMYSPGY
jgi:hypothetical protein